MPGEIFSIDGILSADDAKRARRTLQKLSRHDVADWALSGGLATEIHCRQRGETGSSNRPLNDIDFLAPGFDSVPESLARDFVFRHVHPHDPPGKTILQLIDIETRLRIDLFRADAGILARAKAIQLPGRAVPLISAADVVARAARVLLPLRDNVPAPAKHAHDYIRLERLTDPVDLEAAWPDHRKPDQPVRFQEANETLQRLIATHGHLLISPEYSHDTAQICSRCAPTRSFPLADPKLVLSLLGYC